MAPSAAVAVGFTRGARERVVFGSVVLVMLMTTTFAVDVNVEIPKTNSCGMNKASIRTAVETSLDSARAELNQPGLAESPAVDNWQDMYTTLPPHCSITGTLGRCAVYIPVTHNHDIVQSTLSAGMFELKDQVEHGSFVTIYQTSCAALPDITDLCYTSTFAFTITMEPLRRFVSGYATFLRKKQGESETTLAREDILKPLEDIVTGKYHFPQNSTDSTSFFSLMVASFLPLGKLDHVGSVANLRSDWDYVLNMSQIHVDEDSLYRLRHLRRSMAAEDEAIRSYKNDVTDHLTDNGPLRRALCKLLKPDYTCFKYDFDACLDASALQRRKHTIH